MESNTAAAEYPQNQPARKNNIQAQKPDISLNACDRHFPGTVLNIHEITPDSSDDEDS
jgi:hypothetical protein